MESISKYNLHGIEYVKLTELTDLVNEMKQKCMKGTEPGYICEDEDQRRAAMLALNRLGAVLNKEKIEERMHAKVEQARKEREAREKVKAVAKRAKEALDRAVDYVEGKDEEDEPAGSWMVYKPGKTRGDWLVFRMWDNGEAILGKDGGMIFTYEGMAQHVAEKLGPGWVVIDVSQDSVKRAERLLEAIFRDDDEYHGDGTRAEDEEWDE